MEADARRLRFEALYDTTVDRVMAYCLRHTGSEQAEEVLADTFLVAWRRLDDVPDPALPWLLVTARNHLYAWRRRAARRADLSLRMARISVLAAESAELTAERRADLVRGLAALSSDETEVLLLIAWDGLTPAEASGVVGCSPGAFRVRLHRARARFAAAVADSPEPSVRGRSNDDVHR